MSSSRLPVLSGDYIAGYTRALMDVKEIFEYLQSDPQFKSKAWNWNKLSQLMKCVLANKDNLREHHDKGFIRWNKMIEKFEWHEEKKK